jgi:cysteine desulfurase/selenocysteine lyase
MGLGSAIDFMTSTGMEEIAAHEKNLLDYATRQLLAEGGIRIIGTAKEKTGVVSYLINNIHPFDAGTILDKLGIAIRTGHHCTQPLMDHYGIPGTMRASFAVYNTTQEIDIMMEAIIRTKKMFGV